MIEPTERATGLTFEQLYGDDSGVEYGVTYDSTNDDDEITFERVGELSFPKSRLDWLIGCLERIRAETTPEKDK